MHDFTLQEIEYFLAAAERLNFTEAAQTLFASQSVISKCVKRLENDLGVKLFHRDNRGVSLTAEGEFLYDKWSFLLRGFNESVEAVQTLHHGERKYLHIGCLSEFEHEIGISEFIQCYEEKYLGTTVMVHLYGFKELREQLISGNCDLIISYQSEVEDIKDTLYKNITLINHYIALSSKHRLAEKEDLKLQDLNRETYFILSPAESKKAANRILAAFSGIGFKPAHIEYFRNMPSLSFAISQGKGVSICNKLVARGYESEIKLIPFHELFHNVFLAVAWRKDNMSPELQKLVDMI
jgi:DNA-binding transcriptional LysR family regulator